MATTNPQQNAIGIEIIYGVRQQGVIVDLGSATNLKLLLGKPSGAYIVVTAGLYTDGTDGKLLYATVANDLDEYGPYNVQAYFTLGGYTGHTAKVPMYVEENVGEVT